jgi:hypothetical protein
MSERQMRDGWDKFQIWSQFGINVVALIVIAVAGMVVDSTLKSREVNVKYVGMAVDILRAKPDPSQKNLRSWAINVINAYSKIPLPLEAQEELKTNSLPAGKLLLDSNGNVITDSSGNGIMTQ